MMANSHQSVPSPCSDKAPRNKAAQTLKGTKQSSTNPGSPGGTQQYHHSGQTYYLSLLAFSRVSYLIDKSNTHTSRYSNGHHPVSGSTMSSTSQPQAQGGLPNQNPDSQMVSINARATSSRVTPPSWTQPSRANRADGGPTSDERHTVWRRGPPRPIPATTLVPPLNHHPLDLQPPVQLGVGGRTCLALWQPLLEPCHCILLPCSGDAEIEF